MRRGWSLPDERSLHLLRQRPPRPGRRSDLASEDPRATRCDCSADGQQRRAGHIVGPGWDFRRFFHLLLGGTHETLARAIHEEYVRAQTAAGDTPQTNAALFPWDELPEHVKESNRRQADHVGAKLKAVGCGLAPLTDWDAESFSFTPEEVDVMARLEHDRFVRERRSGGWTHVPGLKNLASQTGPDLVPWEALSEGVREKDRNAVRGLPRFLARAGLQIHWLQEAEDAIVPTVPTQ
jgi:hypothetical protein